MTKQLVCFVIVAVGVALGASPAASAGGCEEGDRTFGCKIEVGARNRTVTYPGPSSFTWSRSELQDSLGAPASCPARPVAGEPDPIFGVPWLIVVRRVDTGEIISISGTCEYPPEPPPEPPGPPPVPADVRASERELGEVDTGLSPPEDSFGVSQLDTWFWCDDPGTVDLNLSLGGYRIEASVRLDDLVWSIDGPDGQLERSASDCGSEPGSDSTGGVAAATWTPNEPGDYVIQLHAWWSGSWTMSYDDPYAGRIDLGTYELRFDDVAAQPLSYEVREIQTVGVPNP